MRKLLLLAVVLATVGCTATLSPSIISLSGKEKQMAIALVERRQTISIQRQEAQGRFQQEMDRLAEQEQAVNIDSEKLCFELKKAHLLDPTQQYSLDEYKGQLIKH